MSELVENDVVSQNKALFVKWVSDNLNPDMTKKPLRFIIKGVFEIDRQTVVAGRLESGILRTGEKLIIMPSGKITEALLIERNHVVINEARPREDLGIVLKGLAKKNIQIGEVIGGLGNPPNVADTIDVKVMLLNRPDVMREGTTVQNQAELLFMCNMDFPIFLRDGTMSHYHFHHPFWPSKIHSKIDFLTGKVLEPNPRHYKAGDTLVATFNIPRVVVEKATDIPPLGAFRIMGNMADTDPKRTTLALGLCTNTMRRK